MEELAYNDIVQQYHRTVVLYKGEPVYVTAVGEDKPTKVRILDLMSQRSSTVDFNLVDFTPPAFRIGNVNVEGGVFHVARKPVRKMQVGLNVNNTIVGIIGDGLYPNGTMNGANRVGHFNSIEIANAIKGNYPSFEECLEFVKQFKGTMAWDRQFSISATRHVFYRTKTVGQLPRNCTRMERIQFYKGYEHLDILLGDNCGKALQASRSK